MKTRPIHHTNILPLRWLANYVFSPIHHFFFKLYLKWGTSYQVIDWDKDEVLKRLGSDYDESGTPYWEKWDAQINCEDVGQDHEWHCLDQSHNCYCIICNYEEDLFGRQ